ncbi:MAG: response regulator [Burkholderiaceae bacterium]|nr:response regulator [Burkholderiaceae bacterium]
MNVDNAGSLVIERPFRLLVLEDSELDYELLVATLSRDRLPVAARRIETRAQLLEALRDDKWDAVIADHQLPTFSGTEALQLVRASDRVLPFLVVSGTLGEEAAVAAMRSGADDYLVKGRLARLAPALLNAMALAQARRERESAARALERSEQQLRELYLHLQTVVDDERAAIAREIHDDIGGMLTTLRLDLSWIERNGDTAAADRARHALQTVIGIMQSAQRIQRNLRPPVLDAGLVDAMSWHIGEFRRSTGIGVTFSHNVKAVELDESRAMTVYRTLQESLTNVARHAGASVVRIDLIVTAGELSLEIADDGVGLAPDALEKAQSFGLRGLVERARQVGGWIDLSGGERGACVLLSMPLAGQAASKAEAAT